MAGSPFSFAKIWDMATDGVYPPPPAIEPQLESAEEMLADPDSDCRGPERLVVKEKEREK